MGQMLASSEAPGKPQFIHDISVSAAGTSAILNVANEVTTDGTATIKQDREFGWNGSNFAQIGGPATF